MRYTLMIIIFTLLPCELVREYIMNPGPVSKATPVVATVEPVTVTPVRVASTTTRSTPTRIRSSREYNSSPSKVYNSAETKFIVDHMTSQGGASRSDAQVFMNVLNQAQTDWEAGR